MIKSQRSSRLNYLFIALAISAATLAIEQWSWVKRLDNLVYDQIITAHTRPPAKNIAIIAIDEKSLEQIGRWPWPRELHTRLLHRLAPLEHSVIGIDIMFSEPETNPAVDKELAHAMLVYDRIVLPVAPVYDFETETIKEHHPLSLFEDAAARLGSVDAELDKDGISRSVYLLSGFSAPIWPSFPLAMLSIKNPEVEDSLPGTRRADSGSLYPGQWARDYHVRIPFTGPPGHYPRISYVDVLDGRTELAELEGKYLFVGITAAGIGDRLPTPTTGHNYQMSGVEYMANILDGLLSNTMITTVHWPYRMAAIFLLVLVPLLIYPILTVRLSLVVWLTAVGFILFLSAALLQWQLWLPPAAALLSVIMTFPVWVWSRLKTSSRRVDEVVQNRSAAMDAIDHGVIILDKELRIEHMNSLAEHITNFMLSDVINLSLNTVLPGMDINNKPMLLEAYQLEDRDGKQNKVYVHINPFSDRWGSSRGFVLNLSLEPLSLSNMADNEKESHYDELTGLYDRTYISRLIAQAIKEGTVSNELYILNIDIDNLALVGDTQMHKSTNRILQELVQRLQSVTGKDNTPGRLGSDQLVLLIDDSDMTKIEKIAAEIINQAKTPITIDRGQVILSINIGISHYPTDGKTAKTLLKHASFAIRQNESAARTRYKFYSRKDHEISMLDHGIEQGLRKSLNEDSLSLVYQPQISLKTGELVGFEALLRWINEDGMYVSTDQAISIAEKSDLINQIGQWVINTGCQQMQRWQQSGIPAVRLSINLSPKDLEQPDFLDDTKAIIHLRGIDPSFLEFEITEHSVLKHTDLSVNILNSFKAMGASLAIDDFGTGYSSFNYLKTLPISTVKIDKSFVEDMVDIKDDAFIVLSMISMSHGLGINVIAEGVETPEQARILKQHGCDVIQGYLVSRPIPASDIANWLDEECHHKEGKYYYQAGSTWEKKVPEH